LLAIIVWFFFAINSGHATCAVSTPNLADPEGTLRSFEGFGWFGSESLAAIIPADGHWQGMGLANNYRNKFWWWRKGFTEKPMSELVITAIKLGTEESFVVSTNGYAYEGSDSYSWDAMIVAMEFPSSGCWKVTGEFADAQLDIMLQVGDDE